MLRESLGWDRRQARAFRAQEAREEAAVADEWEARVRAGWEAGKRVALAKSLAATPCRQLTDGREKNYNNALDNAPAE